jgi:antitoxin component YwqK of YwqJK toxin-antitoxin module
VHSKPNTLFQTNPARRHSQTVGHNLKMKVGLILILVFLAEITYGQNDSSHLNIDTIEYQFDSTGAIDSWWHNLEEGVNLIVDTASNFKMIGTAHKRFKLGFLIRFGRGMYTTKVGLWTYYCNGQVIGFESFDKKGRTLGKVEMYDNGQVKSSMYRANKKDKFEYSESYFQDGSPVRVPEDLENWIYETKEKNCAQQRL